MVSKLPWQTINKSIPLLIYKSGFVRFVYKFVGRVKLIH